MRFRVFRETGKKKEKEKEEIVDYMRVRPSTRKMTKTKNKKRNGKRETATNSEVRIRRKGCMLFVTYKWAYRRVMVIIYLEAKIRNMAPFKQGPSNKPI